MANPKIHNPAYASLPATAAGAKALGVPFFYTGKPCRHGHLSHKYASSGNCVQCIEEKRGIVFQNNIGRMSPENMALADKAMQNGFSVYKSSTPCPNGHTTRFVGGNNCVQCNVENLQKRKEKARWARIKKIYGINAEDFARLLDEQKHKCAICETKLHNKNTHIDHCHSTGKVRALLCSRCNQGIGLFDEDPAMLEKARLYIMEHNNA